MRHTVKFREAPLYKSRKDEMRSGRSLEKLVLYLKRHRVGKGTVLIESPKRLRDKSTGRLCKHDVVLTINSGYHEVLVAIECRERGRPVGLSQLEAFAQKCSATSINKSVIVSSCGFTKTALVRQRHLAYIVCLLSKLRVSPGFIARRNSFRFERITRTSILRLSPRRTL